MKPKMHQGGSELGLNIIQFISNLKWVHVDLCCDVMLVGSKNKGERVRAHPKVYHSNLNMYGTYCEERSDTNSSLYAFPLPLPGRPDRIKYLECFVL